MRRLVVLVLAGAVVAACSGRGPQAVGGTQPSWRGTTEGGTTTPQLAKPVTFAPSGQPAIRYNEPLQTPPRSGLGDAVVVAVREEAQKAGTQVPIADARLF